MVISPCLHPRLARLQSSPVTPARVSSTSIASSTTLTSMVAPTASMTHPLPPAPLRPHPAGLPLRQSARAGASRPPSPPVALPACPLAFREGNSSRLLRILRSRPTRKSPHLPRPRGYCRPFPVGMIGPPARVHLLCTPTLAGSTSETCLTAVPSWRGNRRRDPPPAVRSPTLIGADAQKPARARSACSRSTASARRWLLGKVRRPSFVSLTSGTGVRRSCTPSRCAAVSCVRR